MTKTKQKKPPLKLKKYFWDVKFINLDLQKHRKFILERMLNYGAFDTFSWIFNTFNTEEVQNLINKKGILSLSKNSYYFWAKIVKVKRLWKKN